MRRERRRTCNLLEYARRKFQNTLPVARFMVDQPSLQGAIGNVYNFEQVG